MTEHKGELELNEEAFSYPGWRVTVASGIGVFVSFGSLLVYTFGIFLKPLPEEFAWSRQAVSLAFGIAATEESSIVSGRSDRTVSWVQRSHWVFRGYRSKTRVAVRYSFDGSDATE